jgi:hypothetical protein
VTEQKPNTKLFTYLRIFLIPTLVGKVLILYFGIHMALYPDRGYGYGLVASMVFLLLNFAVFLYMNYRDEEED